MASAKVSQSYIALIKQVPATPLVVPATPLLQKVNFLSADLTAEVATKASNHVRADQMQTDLIRQGLTVKGGYAFEFQYENSLLDAVLESALWGTFINGGTLTKICKNASVYQPFYIEQGHADVGQYHQYIGMAIDSFSLEIPERGEITGSYQFIGLNSNMVQVITTGATYADPTINPVFSSGFNVSQMAINGTPLTNCIIKNLSIEVKQNVTAKTGPGIVGACETIKHRTQITGKLSMYFEDATMQTRLRNGTPFALSVTLLDSNAKSYKITLPRCFVGDNKAPLTGIDADIMENVSFIAARDTTTGCMIQIEKN